MGVGERRYWYLHILDRRVVFIAWIHLHVAAPATKCGYNGEAVKNLDWQMPFESGVLDEIYALSQLEDPKRTDARETSFTYPFSYNSYS